MCSVQITASSNELSQVAGWGEAIAGMLGARRVWGLSCPDPLSTGSRGLDVENVIYPHFISGPLDLEQRLEFL